MKVTLTLFNQDGSIKTGKNDHEEEKHILTKSSIDFVYLSSQIVDFTLGDYFEIELSKENQYLIVQLDPSLAPALIFVPNQKWHYPLRIGDNWKEATKDGIFKSKQLYCAIRVAKPFEINQYQNLSLNTHDLNHETGAYPHATANVETRNDATFFAMNAIDGVYANNSHGSYPYQSWGVNQQDDAELKIDFGRLVEISEVELTLRADFPHDNYWIEGIIGFSNGTETTVQLEKTDRPQTFKIETVKTEWAVLKGLIKDTTLSSPFPALTQIGLFGRNILK